MQKTALGELLSRLEASPRGAVCLGNGELREWPARIVAALRSARFLVKAPAASSLVCPGCECQCFKPVELYPVTEGQSARAYIFCDEPEDMGRVEVGLDALEQWRATSGILAAAVARSLGLTGMLEQDGSGKCWTLGRVRGRKREAAIKLTTEGRISLAVAGHSVALEELFSFDGNELSVDKNELLRLVDKAALPAQVYQPSTARREVRKLDTQQKYATWKKAARELRHKPQGKSERWVAVQIAKMSIAQGSTAETIRKHIRR